MTNPSFPPGKGKGEGSPLVSPLFCPPEVPGPAVKIQALFQADSTPHHAQGYAWDPASCLWKPLHINPETNRLLVDTELSIEDITISTVDVVQPGTQIEEYNEVNSVAAASLTTIVTFTVPIAPAGQVFHLRHVTASGCNVAAFQLEINGVVKAKKRSYWCDFNVDFFFESETGGSRQLVAGDVVRVRVEHNRPDLSPFNATIYGRLV